MDIEGSRQSLDRLSVDTAANINEDLTLESELSGDSRPKRSESIFSSLRTSIDGNPGYINNFNILKSGIGHDDECATKSTILGPNAIFDLTQGLDTARTRSHKALRSQVSVNSGSIFYNLNKPSTRDIPPIQLASLKNKVSSQRFMTEVIDEVAEEYLSFENSYKPLTTDVLSHFSKNYDEPRDPVSPADVSDDEISSDVIPKIFEDANFRLDDPRVFRQVMHNSKFDNQLSISDQLENNSEMQEILSRYLDSVELQLVSEISKTSSSFFTTLGDINSIKSQSKVCAQSLREIDQKLQLVDTAQSVTGREILNLLDERKSVDRLENSLLQLKSILQGVDDAREYFHKGRHVECLDKILTTESLIVGADPDFETASISDRSGSEKSLVDMSQLTSLRNGRKVLAELKKSCNEGYINKFSTLLVEDLRSHYRSVPVKDTITRIQSISNTTRNNEKTPHRIAYLSNTQELKEALQLFIKNLIKGSCLMEAFSRYQDCIITETKAIIRQILPIEATTDQLSSSTTPRGSSNNSESDLTISREKKDIGGLMEAKRLTLSGNIKTLSDSAFCSMISSIFATLSECLRRSTVHQKVLLDLALTSLSPQESQNFDVMSLDLTPAINKAIEITQGRLVKVLNVRVEQLGDLPIKDYYDIFSLASAYLSECESINPGYTSTESGRSLTEWVKNHVGYFIHRFHSNSVKKLAVACDKETWREFIGDELEATQFTIDKIVSCSDSGKAERAPDAYAWAMMMLDGGNSDVASKPKQAPSTKVSLEDKLYFIPHLVVLVVKTTRDYVILSKIFGTKAFGIMQNLLTYLKVLISRISIAVLNAGATRTAGLRHITTKHIALCIQTVDFLAGYSCNLQEVFQKIDAPHDGPQNTEYPTFETPIQQLRDHKNELIAKLVSIMRDRTLSHCDAIRKIDLSTQSASTQQCRPYMETLVKETLTVSKVIGKYLNSSDCFHIMLQIFENYKNLLVNCYCGDLPQLKDFNEKHSLLKDIDYFRVRLGEVDGYGSTGQVIWENVNSLPTLEDITMEEKMRHNSKRETTAPKEASKDTGSLKGSSDKSNTSIENSDERRTEVTDLQELTKVGENTENRDKTSGDN